MKKTFSLSGSVKGKAFAKFQFVTSFIVLISLFSCSDDSSVGKWDDNIKLSQKSARVDADKGSILITTKGDSWWLNEIFLNKKTSIDLKGTNTTSKNFVIEKPEFRIERKNATEIHITMTKNSTGSERTLSISLQSGNYFDGITIIQEGS